MFFTVELCVYSWMEKPLACDVSEKRSSLNTLFHTLKSPGYPRICIGRSARLELEWYPAWPISGQFLTPVRHCLWSWEFRTQYVIMCLKCIMRRGFRGPKETAGFLAGFSSVAFLTHVERLLFLIKATNAKVTSLWLYGSGRCPGALGPYFYRLVVGGHRHTHTPHSAEYMCPASRASLPVPLNEPRSWIGGKRDVSDHQITGRQCPGASWAKCWTGFNAIRGKVPGSRASLKPTVKKQN